MNNVLGTVAAKAGTLWAMVTAAALSLLAALPLLTSRSIREAGRTNLHAGQVLRYAAIEIVTLGA